MKKECKKCGKSKDIDEFYLKSKRVDGVEPRYDIKCKVCSSNYHKERNKNNPKLIIRNARNREDRKKVINDAKRVPCKDCGESYPPFVMDFDHLPGVTKIASLAQMVRGSYSKEQLKEEIQKCAVVCANCHRFRTNKRYRGRLAEAHLKELLA
jgi:hypothetical protein